MMAQEDIIVAAVDGSPAALHAVRWAARTAKTHGIPLRLAISYSVPHYLFADGQVPPDELFKALQDEALAAIEEARDVAHEEAPDILIAHTIAEGSPIDMLLDMSAEVKLLVLGSRGLGDFSGMVMGSVSAAVVSHAECPVVVIRESKDGPMPAGEEGPVVLGIDGSEVSQRATEVAFEEAAVRRVPLIAVHTWMDAHGHASLARYAEPAPERWAMIQEQQEQFLKQCLAEPIEKHPDVNVEVVIANDRPAHVLAERSKAAQLLVVGSHGRGGFRGMLIGSTSRALLQSAACPVMVVRADKG